MYKPPDSYDLLCRNLKDIPEIADKAELLTHVELGFGLMEFLGVDDEPITALWVLLSGMPIHFPRLHNLSAEQRRAWANARIIIPYSARTAWDNALREYMFIPETWRDYEFDPDQLENSLVVACKRTPVRHTRHQTVYKDCLSTFLPYRETERRYIRAGQPYQFQAEVQGGKLTVEVEFTSEHVDLSSEMPPHWLNMPRARFPIEIELSKLLPVAEFLDRREIALREQAFPVHIKTTWVQRLADIRYCLVHKGEEETHLGESNIVRLCIDGDKGMTHLAGMVGSGKSTLAILIAAANLYYSFGWRVTLVVNDTLTSLRLANQFDYWFADDPDKDTPVAVAIIGRSDRHHHLERFHRSRDYLDHRAAGKGHWAERWLSVMCPVQSLIRPHDLENKLDYQLITPGKEPCNSIKTPQVANKRAGQSHLCPLFAICPSKQLYRDMPKASVWITTPGALAQSSIPGQLSERKVMVGDLVYEQSDLVVFDEVETIIDWFDKVYAEKVDLTNGANGVLDQLETQTKDYALTHRVRPSSLTSRWIAAQEHSLMTVTDILTHLDERQGRAVLRQWVERGSFTAFTLYSNLTRRLAGLKDMERRDASVEERRANETLLETSLPYFEELFEIDPLRAQAPIAETSGSRFSYKQGAFELAEIIKEINNTGESSTDPEIHVRCVRWIQTHFPDVEEQLLRLQNTLSISNQPEDHRYQVDTIDTLAQRLHFILDVVLLDRHTRIVFYEWHNRPDTIDMEQPHRHIPRGMLDILPLPLTGRQFGTYYSRIENGPDDGHSRTNNKLSLFAYVSIGRSYILDFHKLRLDLDGQRGPNVLAMSGTSYLPDSVRFHVGNGNQLPDGILQPDEETISAISGSRFEFLPQYSLDGPIRVSGEEYKKTPIENITASLVGADGGGKLQDEFDCLSLLAEQEPNRWHDRNRLLLLVNSYSQAEWAASVIRHTWPDMRDQVYHLVRGTDDAPESMLSYLGRADIETFAQTGGRILIAPLASIGRGFNILNDQGIAAFGTVYFLTRPYPHPFDVQAIAQELNRRALDWAADPTFSSWQEDGIYGRALRARQFAARYWRKIELRNGYRSLFKDEELQADPRRDLAATTVGHVIQAIGRLVRGGVPFRAYFVDAAWAPNSATLEEESLDTQETSLLVAMIEVLADYVAESPVGSALYKPLLAALEQTYNLKW